MSSQVKPELAVDLRGVCRRYGWSGGEVTALDGIDLEMEVGEAVALMGPSGSGKTTLLNLVGGLDRPTAGTISVFGSRLDTMTERSLTSFRAHALGIVFQDPHLLPGFSALDNVVLSRLPWRPVAQLRAEAEDLLDEVGLGGRLGHAPGRLPGGERQRWGTARALAGRPRPLLAEVPPGHRDT